MRAAFPRSGKRMALNLVRLGDRLLHAMDGPPHSMVGRLFREAARWRDYPVLSGIILINALLIILANLAADLLYGKLDPRVTYD